jgi:hypothetical protein
MPARTPMSLQPGQSLGPYTISAPLVREPSEDRL